MTLWLGVAYALGSVLHLFYTLMWFDMVVHCSAGVAIGLLVYMTFEYVSEKPMTYSERLRKGISIVLLIGLLWECYELYFGITSLRSADYFADNGMDVVMDTLGGMIALFYAQWKVGSVSKLNETTISLYTK